MVESPDFNDPVHGIPVFSLYGEVRRPTDAMMDSFDVLLVDLQDLGCRIYTFITTLRYVLEAAARHGKSVWVLDRPNPIGRPVEGLSLRAGWESFVGAGEMPMRHGLTLGEMGRWFVQRFGLDVDYRVVEMQGWQPGPCARLRLAARRAHVGQPEPECTEPVDGALLPGHRDARGHDAVRGPRHDAAARTVRRAGPRRARRSWPRCSGWRRSGCAAAGCARAGSSRRSTSMSGRLCAGLQLHVEDGGYDHAAFRPWRVQALAFKALRRLQAGLRPVARFPVRIRARPPRHRPDQRQRTAASLGRRSIGDACRSRLHRNGRRKRLAGGARGSDDLPLSSGR